jgi:hypothetical protein
MTFPVEFRSTLRWPTGGLGGKAQNPVVLGSGRNLPALPQVRYV